LSEPSYSKGFSTGWFALYTSSRHEKRVSKILGERSVENFLPLYLAKRHWQKRSPVSIELPLFPNYVFVRAGQKASLLSVPGVLSIVGTEREPWLLPDDQIKAFRCAMAICKFEPQILFEVGERVRIKRGALAGMQGVLLRKKNGLRVVLTIEAIRSSVAVEVDDTDLEALDDRSIHLCEVPLLRPAV
jgi:transcription antitermination factor NusG